MTKVYLSGKPYHEALFYPRGGLVIPIGDELLVELEEDAIARLAADPWLIVRPFEEEGEDNAPSVPPADPPAQETADPEPASGPEKPSEPAPAEAMPTAVDGANAQA